MAAVTRNERIWFWALLALAILLRALNFSAFAMHHPDEVLQYLEPAYRLLTGDGIVTWEYRYGMRSWLLPWLLAGPMAVGQAIGGSWLTGIVAARIAGAIIGLIPVIGAWHLGRRLSPTHGIVAMAAMAVWYEQIVFSTHLLTESLATSLFIGAAALIDRKEPRSGIVAGGALLAFAVVFRFHYAVAAGVFVLLAFSNDWKRWGWLIAGAVPVVLLSCAVDLAMGQWPFQWVWTNVQLNLIEGRSARFGLNEPWFFITAIWGQWGWLTVPIAILAVEAGKQYRPLLYAAIFNLAVHSLVGHKEYRFIELTTAALVLLAGIGSVNAWRWLENRRDRAFPSSITLAALLVAWAGTSAWLGTGRPLDQWFGRRSTGPELVYAAGRDPRVCGVAGMTVEYWQLSRTYLGRPMPIILLESASRPARLKRPGPELASVNAVIAPTGSERVLPGYSATLCKGNQPYRRCLYVRPGGCAPTPEAEQLEIQRLLLKFDS
jgi:phosphatidylinositol glycan class B